MDDELDLDAYLERIGLRDRQPPSLETLRRLHFAHVGHIPFENLDILLGRPIRIDIKSLQAKLVADRRGGYCFEQNTLFASALRAIGFEVTLLAARVRFGTTRVLARTHMVLKVDSEGAEWLADVGFGAAGPLLPIRFGDPRETQQFAWTYRLVRNAGHWVLQSLREGAWSDLYAFSLEPQLPVDFEVTNHYVSTHPESRFVRALTVQRATPEERYTLVDRDLAIERPAGTERRSIASDDLLGLLARTFGLEFPRGTRFPLPEAT